MDTRPEPGIELLEGDLIPAHGTHQKIILEEKVRERTAELEQKITELTAGQDVAEG